jgi:hypothetical protein
MVASDYTDVFAHFSDKVAADVLANYIAEAGFPCDVIEVFDPVFGRRYGIRVARSLIEDLKESLELTPIAKYGEVVSPEVVAARLAREKIPCYVGAPPVLLMGVIGAPAGYTGVPIDDTGKLGLGTLAVPARFMRAAHRVLEQQFSDAELTRLALENGPDTKDPP